MAERSESYGDQLAQLMSPELARNPQPAYVMLREGSPVMRLDGVGVIVSSRQGWTRCSGAPTCSRRTCRRTT
jgi:hypothetical protein